MGKTIYASFDDASMAEKAAGALLDHGVRAEDLSVISGGHTEDATVTRTYADRTSTIGSATYPRETVVAPTYTGSEATAPSGAYVARDYAVTDKEYDAEAKSESKPEDIEGSAKHGISTTTGKDAGAGAAKGAAWGLGIGVVAGLVSLFIPGVGLVWGAGALATAIGAAAATTAGGAIAGAVEGYLVDQGVSSEFAQQCGHAVSNGGAVLAISVPSGDVTEIDAQGILSKYGAANFNGSTIGTNDAYLG